MEYRHTFPGSVTTWNGFARHDFKLNDWDAILVEPSRAAEGRPWIWRTTFFDAWPAADIRLLQLGFHVAQVDIVDFFGNSEALQRMDTFYAFLTKEHQLAGMTLLEGFSRGGLPAYNWTARNAGKVCGLYGDAPVCDFKSWPGGKGKGTGSPDDWLKCLAAYGFTEEEAMRYSGNPIDSLLPLAARDIPILHVCGEADDVVPVAENTTLVETRYPQLGGRIKVILKPGIGHHPHSLEDPTPIVDFVLEAWNRARQAHAEVDSRVGGSQPGRDTTPKASAGYSTRFRAARERAGLSREDAAAKMEIPPDCIWDIESQDEEICTSYSPADVRRFCIVLGIRPADLFNIRLDAPPITAPHLAHLIQDHCRTHNITLPAFEDAVGWRLAESIEDPEALFEDLSIDGIRWVCDELGVDWRRIVLGLYT